MTRDLLKRTVFFISDGTGITAETLGHSVLAQFVGLDYRQSRIPFVDSVDKARECVSQINAAREAGGARPLAFTSLVDTDAIAMLRTADALFLDLFEGFIGPLEQELGLRSTHTIGRFHGIDQSEDYKRRIEAINFTLAHDDGVSDVDLGNADVILLGVSRSGKTPTSLYLAMQFGVKAANYPLIPEDFERRRLPSQLQRHHAKLFGLNIDPVRLHSIRSERRPDSRYAALENCRYEVDEATKLMRRHGIHWIDSTAKSIEEISATIMQEIRLNRHGY